MFRNILQRLAGMVSDMRQRFQASSGNTATKSAPQRANANRARAKGQKPGHRPKNTPHGRAVKKR